MTLKKTQIIYETGGIGLDEVNLLKYLNENKFHISEDDYYCSSRTDIDDKNNKNTHNGTIYCTYRNKLFSIEWRNRRVNIKYEDKLAPQFTQMKLESQREETSSYEQVSKDQHDPCIQGLEKSKELEKILRYPNEKEKTKSGLTHVVIS